MTVAKRITPRERKPVRGCCHCPLNMGNTCWAFLRPRERWSDTACPAVDSPEILTRFADWRKLPVVKSRKELRRERYSPCRRKLPPAHLEKR